jgi:hypothetical protein
LLRVKGGRETRGPCSRRSGLPCPPKPAGTPGLVLLQNGAPTGVVPGKAVIKGQEGVGTGPRRFHQEKIDVHLPAGPSPKTPLCPTRPRFDPVAFSHRNLGVTGSSRQQGSHPSREGSRRRQLGRFMRTLLLITAVLLANDASGGDGTAPWRGSATRGPPQARPSLHTAFLRPTGESTSTRACGVMQPKHISSHVIFHGSSLPCLWVSQCRSPALPGCSPSYPGSGGYGTGLWGLGPERRVRRPIDDPCRGPGGGRGGGARGVGRAALQRGAFGFGDHHSSLLDSLVRISWAEGRKPPSSKVQGKPGVAGCRDRSRLMLLV